MNHQVSAGYLLLLVSDLSSSIDADCTLTPDEAMTKAAEGTLIPWLETHGRVSMKGIYAGHEEAIYGVLDDQSAVRRPSELGTTSNGLCYVLSLAAGLVASAIPQVDINR